MRPGDRRARPALLALLIVAGCALSPPSPAPPPPAASGEARPTPRVHGADGELTGTQARKVMRTLARQGESDLLARHLRATEGLVAAPLRVGNSAERLIDGPATHEAMFSAMEAATGHINLETYILEADAIGRQLADLLIRKRAQGVRVHLIYDGVGSIG